MNDDLCPDCEDDGVVPSNPFTWASLAIHGLVFAGNVFNAASDLAGGLAQEFAGHHNYLVDRKVGQELESLLKDEG